MKNRNNYKRGMIAALSCATLWGILPIYWKLISAIPSQVIIFYRVFWVGMICLAVSIKLYGLPKLLSYGKDKRQLFKFFIAGLIITTNWSMYIWAVNAGYIIQTSIGYYMEPLMVALIGIIIFKERLARFKILAFFMAALGLLILIIHFRQLPSIAIILAISFAFYAGIKKTVDVPAIVSLFYETSFFIIPAFLIVIFLETKDIGALHYGTTGEIILLCFSGVLTAIPLGLFGVGAANLPLTTLGITEYISPSLALIIGIYMYKEPFDSTQLLAFIAIWIGLIIFTIGEKRAIKNKEGL